MFSDDPSYLPGHTVLDKPPLPPIRSQQEQVIQSSTHFHRSDSPKPFIMNANRPKTGHPSNNHDGSPSGATRRRLPKITGAATLPAGAPPLYIGAANNHPTLPKVGEEDSIEVGSFPEDIPASILDQNSNVDTLDDAVVAIIKSEEDAKVEDEDLNDQNELNIDSVKENDETGEDNIEQEICDDVDGDNASVQEECQKIDPLEGDSESNAKVGTSPDDNLEENGSNIIENAKSTDEIKSNLEENNENDVKDDEDEKSNHEDMDADEDEGPVVNGSLKEDQVPIEEDDDNDVMSPNEVSREASAQSARSGVLSPLNVSPKATSRLATPSPMSPKSQTSRSASRLSSKRSPSATLNPNTYNTYTSPSKSPGLASPRMGSSSSRKSSKQVSRASSRLDASKLGMKY